MSGAFLQHDKVSPASFAFSCRSFRLNLVPPSRSNIGFGSASNISTQAKTGLEWGTRRILLAQQSMKSSRKTVARSSGSDRVLVIMAKAPRAGMVKTRLAPNLSPEAVIDFYCCLLEDTLALARSLGDVEVAIMCPDSDVNELAQLAGSHASVVAQKGEGLAAGLTSVFAHFAEGHQRRVIAFNSDSPHLPRSVLEDAFETLAAHDVVVGPTHDGGYYLVGAKASHPTLFAGDGMGTSSALERLLSRARTLELSVGFADPFYDVDVADDLTRLAAELRQTPARAPRTAGWLKEWERSCGAGTPFDKLRAGSAR
jgi:uncharacterized protein